MVIRINNEVTSVGPIEWVVREEAEAITRPFVDLLTEFARDILGAINACSAELITLGICVCAGGMMLGPLVGNTKWTGRLFLVFWCGIVWRVIT